MSTLFADFMVSLTGRGNETTPLTAGEEWGKTIQRIKMPGKVHTIQEETYWYFLEVLPPIWMNQKGVFAFAEGMEPLSLFWLRKEGAFCRQLTNDETNNFCEVSGVSKTYWH